MYMGLLISARESIGRRCWTWRKCVSFNEKLNAKSQAMFFFLNAYQFWKIEYIFVHIHCHGHM